MKHAGKSWCLFLETECPNKNIYISEICVLLKTYSQKLCYALKLIILIYTLDCNVFGIYKQKLAKVIGYFLLTPSSTILPTPPFPGEKLILPHFLENKQNLNSHPLCKVGDIQLWLIQTTCFRYLLLQIKPLIIKTFNFKFENVSFTKLLKNIYQW